MDLDEAERAERITLLRDIVGQEMDEETCAALLASNNWNVESTARNFYEDPSSPRNQPSAPAYLHELDEDEEDEVASFLRRPEESGVRSRRRGISPERAEPAAGRTFRPSAIPIAPPRSFSQILKEAFSGQAHHESSASAARKFVAEFDRLIGSDVAAPEFFESSFEDALLSASTERKLLAVYLHSPWHPFTEPFCRDIICSRSILNALADVRVWGGSIEHPEGYLASSKVQAASFPCLVLIDAARGRDARIVDRLYVDDINDPNLADRFAARIVTARAVRPLAAATPSVADTRAAEERRRVLEEQDAALRAAMEEDRRREEEKRVREHQEQEERRRKEEEEDRKVKAFDAKRLRIQPEPAPNSTGITSLRFQFPGGSKLNRRFLEEDTVQYVRDVLDVHLVDQLKTPNLRYALILNYPKKTIAELHSTLKEAGLVPQAVLFLQDLDA